MHFRTADSVQFFMHRIVCSLTLSTIRIVSFLEKQRGTKKSEIVLLIIDLTPLRIAVKGEIEITLGYDISNCKEFFPLSFFPSEWSTS